ncbi:MAG: ribosome biogenesis GTPase Der, partial [bacterium]
GKPVILVANKAEGRAGEAGALDAYRLGLGEPVAISAEHGEGLADLADALAETLPETAEDPDEDVAETDAVVTGEDGEEEAITLDAGIVRPLRIAIVGRPNAGKSTLVNALIGQQRMLTGPEAGITRDTISIDWEFRGRKIRLFDTAGLRKKANVQDKLEKLSVADAIRAIRFAEVVLLLLDAQIPFEKQDLQIADLVEREGRALVIGLNKWDLVEDRNKTLADAREMLDRLIDRCFDAHRVWNRRVPTSKLNRWLEGVLERHPPPAVSGRRIKIRYMTQVKTRPPHFALFGNQLQELPDSYTRYLVHGLREIFDMPGVPIRLSLRSKKNPFDRT